eukprot:CAMPEP_0202958458 /NCGR_PEP_ID=MMETSP1396-20130829/2799_1 /ASSEMBLY_ACC=CAM_ASM_000872 /TAXON_ID= /ORGANISM="Pseudokeronopsis sp., Strain Brazil" /LENGTH=139 /DNA_ID=CAMNT_0049676543 /DNA_START=619 /DNA_END=1038 /DNA_ORIENTATION=+
MTVISRNKGWITVNPETLSRKNCFEKQAKANTRVASVMSPQWMQIPEQRDEAQIKAFKVRPMYGSNTRCEKNRAIFADRQEPPRSIFSIGNVRHNVISVSDQKPLFAALKNYSMQPVRLIEWNEDQTKQKYDKPITAKI